MDNVKANASYPGPNTFDVAADNVEYIYSSEGTEDDDVSNYELAPRVMKKSRVSKRSSGWAAQETFTLLDAWAELRKHGKRGVTSAEWSEVAEKVCEVSNRTRTTTHCHNRIDSLRRTYKKEKAMLAANVGYTTKWVYFKKMDTIVTNSLKQGNVNSLQNLIFETDNANSSDQMRDSLEGGESELAKDRNEILVENENLEDQPPKKTTGCKRRCGELAELEKLRLDLKKEVELEKRKILKKDLAEIATIRGVNIEDNNLPPANLSG